jgi:hypothetical protein
MNNLKAFKAMIGGWIVILIIILLWSWGSYIAPRAFIGDMYDTIECADCPYDDLARCEPCVDIHSDLMPD